jgi:hypothetical protein
MIFADFCSLRMASFERDLLPARSHLVVVALGNKDHCGKVEGGGRNGGSQQWEWKRIERRGSELGKNAIERHQPAIAAVIRINVKGCAIPPVARDTAFCSARASR